MKFSNVQIENAFRGVKGSSHSFVQIEGKYAEVSKVQVRKAYGLLHVFEMEANQIQVSTVDVSDSELGLSVFTTTGQGENQLLTFEQNTIESTSLGTDSIPG